MTIYEQLFDFVNIGIVILDENINVFKWNKWMEVHSGIPADRIINKPLFEFFPNLNNKSFLRSFKYVSSFGGFYFFSQKLHHYLFPFKPVSYLARQVEFMQQNCYIGRLLNDIESPPYVYITVQDVTEIAIYEKTLLETNIKDALTGIYNRRYLESRLKEELKKYKRVLKPFTVAMIDLDFFKSINDHYGHQCGDFILKSVAYTIESNTRETDIIARYGGEEFACLLPDTTLEQGILIAERLRSNVEAQTFLFRDQQLRVTISIGVAELQSENETIEALLSKADIALYEAKRLGRNRVFPAEDL